MEPLRAVDTQGSAGEWSQTGKEQDTDPDP
jgi:hypothetical protein